MGIIKPRGRSAWSSRRGTLHGSSITRRKAKWSGQLFRLHEKPKGRSR